MNAHEISSQFSGPGVMMLSAAIFGYFGFATIWVSTGLNGQFLFYVSVMEWTLKISSVGFLFASGVACVNYKVGNIVYSITGLCCAIAFSNVFVFDVLDPQHMVVHPILLLVFIIWNGLSAWRC